MSLASQRAILMRGDPGLFDILKKGLGFIAKKAAGRIPGGTTAIGLIGAGGRGFPSPTTIALPGGRRLSPPGQVAISSRGAGIEMATAGGCPKGFHANRSSYHTAEGFVQMGTRCVRNRRRNLSNGRANTRALRRMAAWEKQDKKRRQTLAAIARSAK